MHTEKKHKRKTILKNLFLGGCALFLILFGTTALWLSTLRVPDLRSFESRQVTKSTKIFDRNGVLLYDLNQDLRRTEVPFTEISSTIKNATVAIEDEQFYQHSGIRITSFIRALLVNLKSGTFSQGGSTITQQVVKNSLLTQEKTITRKLKEWVLAVKAERELGKDDILSIYLNNTPYGGNIYGIEEASLSYFGKHASELTLTQAAYLAAIPKAPTFYSPYGKHLDKLEERKNIVLEKMNQLGFITKEEYERARQEKIAWATQETKAIKAPHFVFFIKDYLTSTYGEEILLEGGLSITTTLDYKLQQTAEEVVKRYALENAEKKQAENAGMVVMAPKTGQILAMVGSRDYFDKQIDGAYNIATAKRQPGSAFKPIVYAEALRQGFTEKTTLLDVRTQFNPSCNAWSTSSTNGCYSPQNVGGQYFGPVDLRKALAMSLNVASVKLLYLVKPDNALKLANDLGITTLGAASKYGLSLVLGGGEVRLLDMVSAYSVFGAEGVRHPATGILKIQKNDGGVIEEYTDRGAEVLPKNVALTISSILSDNAARAPEFGSRSPLYIPGYDVAVKTGTTNDSKDAWIVGYTPSITVGVWVGNNDNTPMDKKLLSYQLSGPLWHEFMMKVLPTIASGSFEEPTPPTQENLKPVLKGLWQGGETFAIDSVSGKLATEYTPKETRIEKVITNFHSILYWITKADPLGPQPENPYNDPQYKNWETVEQSWWQGHKYLYPHINASSKPTGFDDIHTPENKPTVSIVSPTTGAVFSPNQEMTVRVSAHGKYPIVSFDVFLNGVFIGSSLPGSQTFSFVPANIDGIREDNELRVVVYDSVSNTGETSIHINQAQTIQ